MRKLNLIQPRPVDFYDTSPAKALDELYFSAHGKSRGARDLVHMQAFQRYRHAIQDGETAILAASYDNDVRILLRAVGILLHERFDIQIIEAEKIKSYSIISVEWRPSEDTGVDKLLTRADKKLLEHLRQERFG